MKSAPFLFAVLVICSAGSALSAQEPPSYAKQIAPFFHKYCVACHSDKKPSSGLNLETYKRLMEGGEHGAAVVAGKADESRLVRMLEGLQEPKMPPERAELHPKKGEIAQVRAWVQAGAKFDQEIQQTILPAIPCRVDAAPAVAALAYWPGGKRLVAGCYKKLLVCDTGTGKLVAQLGNLPRPVTALALDKKGERLAVALGQPGAAAQILLYPILTADRVWGRPVVIPDAHADVVQDLAFSPDGKTLVSVGYDRLVRIWDATNGKPDRTLKEHSDSVYGVSFRAGGQQFATAAADRAVKVWQAATGKLLYTLGEATDWVYAVAWSPDGKRLAAGGVDRSIRVWEVADGEAKLVRSVFAHQGPIRHLKYSADGNTLYSTSEDRTIKAWDAHKMTERRVYPAQAEAILSLAVNPVGKQLAIGRFDGALVLLDEQTGKTQSQPLPAKTEGMLGIKTAIQEVEPNNSPGTGQKISLPATVIGAIDRAGDVDYFRFQAEAGQQFGAQVVVDKSKGKPAFDAVLHLTDASGKVLAQGTDGHLGYTFAEGGWYAIGVRDRNYGGSPAMKYELRAGDVPVVTSVFPLGLQRGSEGDIQLTGVNLGGVTAVKARAGAEATPGSKLPLTLPQLKQAPLGLRPLIVGEFPEVLQQQGKVLTVPVPGTANGVISAPGVTNTWKFQAGKGQKLVVEVNARRLGSDLDSYIEILDAQGRPVPVATLRSLAKTFVTFRDHNSVSPAIRMDAWSEFAIDDYVYVGTELLKIKALPPNPDADCTFYSEKGKRLGFLGTTPTHLTKGEPMYKVAIAPPDAKFAPNGFPVVTLYYRNDDGGPDYGRDSRLFFDPPADGVYQVRIGDSNGNGGANFGYRLTVRPPRPHFDVRFSPSNPAVARGGAIPVTVSVDRFDGFAGPIKVWLANLPPGFHAPASAVLENEESTTFALWADAGAKAPAGTESVQLIAEATIAGKVVRKEAAVGKMQVQEPGDLVTTTEQSEVIIKPGQHARLTVNIERRNGFAGRVPISVQGLPHGVRVLDIGLNGILITEKESRRTMDFYCEPWVQAIEHPIVISAQREGKGSQHAARSVLLKVVAPQGK